MSRLRRSLALGFVIAAMAGPALAQEPGTGLGVLEASAPETPPGALLRPLMPGDVLLTWRRGDAAGTLRWPSGLLEVETEQTPLGMVTLHGWRGERPMTWRMPAAGWAVRTRPALPPHLLALYKEGAAQLASREPDRGAESWLAAVSEATRAEDKPQAAWFLGELGNAMGGLRRWTEADAAFERAGRLAQGSGLAAPLLRDWGALHVQRRDWERAESCYRQAHELALKGSFTAARDLAVLADIATHQGDLKAAEHLYRQSLSERSRLAAAFNPYLVRTIQDEVAGFGSPEMRGATSEEVRELRGKLEGLRDTLLKLAGVPPRTGSTMKAAAAVPPKNPEPDPLETLQKELAKAEREAPGSLAVSGRWQDLGTFAFQKGDLVAAEIAWLRALDLREKLAPGAHLEVQTLHDLGRVHAKAARKRAAASFFCRAANSLSRLGKAPEGTIYDQQCLAALVDLQRPEEAFEVLERSRVRDTAPTKDILAERRRAIERLERLSTSRDRDEVDLLGAYIAELEVRRAEAVGPRDLEALRAGLPPGTLLLTWSIGDDRSFLFLVRPAEAAGPGVEAFSIPARARNLRERVLAFAREAAPDRGEAVDLYRQLLGPADDQIATAERLLLLPGEILEPLPFGALVQKPLETAASATAWAAAKDTRDVKDAKGTTSP